MRSPANWVQLARFGLVGASGYVVNLIVFALVDSAASNHRVAATAAFVVALTNNFWWNRTWTFRAREGRAHFQAARFLTVSVVAFAIALGVLEVLLLAADIPAVAAQAISIVCATPVNFLGNRMWSFRL
jgi:putative flippase GtrA